MEAIQFKNLLIPIKEFEDDKIIARIEQNLGDLGATEKEIKRYSKSIKVASETTNIDDRIIVAVTQQESSFKLNAVSPKGYKGLMQTRIASMEHPEVDIMMGAVELRKWIKYRGGDLTYALASYNGGTNPPKQSWEYANKVIFLASRL